jgi:hypothetical protein
MNSVIKNARPHFQLLSVTRFSQDAKTVDCQPPPDKAGTMPRARTMPANTSSACGGVRLTNSYSSGKYFFGILIFQYRYCGIDKAVLIYKKNVVKLTSEKKCGGENYQRPDKNFIIAASNEKTAVLP